MAGRSGAHAGRPWARFCRIVRMTYSRCHLCGCGAASAVDHLVPYALAPDQPTFGAVENYRLICGVNCPCGNTCNTSRTALLRERPEYIGKPGCPPDWKPGRVGDSGKKRKRCWAASAGCKWHEGGPGVRGCPHWRKPKGMLR